MHDIDKVKQTKGMLTNLVKVEIEKYEKMLCIILSEHERGAFQAGFFDGYKCAIENYIKEREGDKNG